MPIERLFFMRHGSVAPAHSGAGAVDDRPLTTRGEALVRFVGEGLARQPVSVDRIITSPALCAVQTASILSGLRDDAPLTDADDRLSPEFTLESLRELIEENADAPTLLLVGHEPSLSRVISEVGGGYCASLDPASIVCMSLLDLRAPRASLFALISPRTLGYKESSED